MIATIPKFSNPQKCRMIHDWPFGRHTCTAHFQVESNKRGERVGRRTTNKTGTGWNNWKFTSYSSKFLIVDGDDGKTYLVGKNDPNLFAVWMSDVQHILRYVHPEDHEYAELARLFEFRPD